MPTSMPTSRIPILFAAVLLALTTAHAQIFTTLLNFDNANGQFPPYGSLVQGPDGNFYGVTLDGGTATACLFGCGTIFKITPSGQLTTLYSFCSQSGCTDGAGPYGGLVLANNGLFYGTTAFGGLGWGLIYSISQSGVYTVVHTFDGTNGADPVSALVQASDGNLYGVTPGGGADSTGIVFKMTLTGTFTTIASFNTFNGQSPESTLVQIGGIFYGTTDQGGANGYGTIFKVTRSGVITGLHSFRGSDGRNPVGGLVPGSNGKLYGTTQFGGSSSACRSGCGTIFEITPSGSFATVHNFDFSDGSVLSGALIQANDGHLYGTTQGGGPGCLISCGTIFEIAGTQLITLYAFSSASGNTPEATVTQGTDGTFYGTTIFGGTNNDGTVFNLSTGLTPLVVTAPTSGKIGLPVLIMGNNLTGATSVTFNGTPATFSVLSNNSLSAKVPPGATSGTVQVTTASGTLNSNPVFQVVP